MNKRFRASYQIAIGFALLASLAIYGYRYANDYLLGREHFAPLIPGDVNIIGVDTSKGYGILVQNRTAKLVFGNKDEFKAGDMSEKSLENSQSEKKYIPIKDMLKALQGDVPGLSTFIQRLNDITDDQLPSRAPVWKTEDIAIALTGDKTLADKLVHDLNMKLDGTPLGQVSKKALFEGIVVDTPVPIEIQMGPELKTIVARVKRPFRASFIANVERRVSQKFATTKSIATEYEAAAMQLKTGDIAKEDLPGELNNFAKSAKMLGEFPQRILSSITCVVNDGLFTDASYRTVPAPKGSSYVLDMNLNEEGKKRLWQFTRDRVNAQLLVTVNGVAIAAPFVQQGISGGEFQVTNLYEESLVQDLVDTIKKKGTTTNK